MSNINKPGEEWSYLVSKYIANTCTREELAHLLELIKKEEYTDDLTRILKDNWQNSKQHSDAEEIDLDQKFFLLMEEAGSKTQKRVIGGRIKRRRFYYAAAAIFLCVISIGTYFLFQAGTKSQMAFTQNLKMEKSDVAPGGNKAVLTLSDGSSIILDSSLNGTLTNQGNTKIMKQNGILSYNSQKDQPGKILYNTVSTPRGGQYQLMLSDGTKVWLNATSSLRFPASFGENERKVELMGEAYFEVAKNASKPFKVKVNGMEVEVLGTHFNINSYEDESAIRTTLLEGSVKLNRNHASAILKPGQQAGVDKKGKISISSDVDMSEAIAWKEGKFQFERADIYQVMRQISRWYNVDIEYKGTVSNHFGGTISRDVNLSQVLKMLHLTGGVKFDIQDHKVVVRP